MAPRPVAGALDLDHQLDVLVDRIVNRLQAPVAVERLFVGEVRPEKKTGIDEITWPRQAIGPSSESSGRSSSAVATFSVSAQLKGSSRT